MTKLPYLFIALISLMASLSACKTLDDLAALSPQPENTSQQRTSIPPTDKVSVYVLSDGKIINHAAPGASLRRLPTKDYYMESDGCYVACYSHGIYRSVYSVSSDIHVMGQIRVKGEYYGRVCQPSRFVGKDISKEKYFNTLCQMMLPTRCSRHSCWAGGDTGGFFGIL
jgi:hypothetical protein